MGLNGLTFSEIDPMDFPLLTIEYALTRRTKKQCGKKKKGL